MNSFVPKYNGYYPIEAERLAWERLALRREGRFEEADRLRDEVREKYRVGINDLKVVRSGETVLGYSLTWRIS